MPQDPSSVRPLPGFLDQQEVAVAQTVFGNTDTAGATFGQIAAAGTTAIAIPASANVDPPRMFQFQARLTF